MDNLTLQTLATIIAISFIIVSFIQFRKVYFQKQEYQKLVEQQNLLLDSKELNEKVAYSKLIEYGDSIRVLKEEKYKLEKSLAEKIDLHLSREGELLRELAVSKGSIVHLNDCLAIKNKEVDSLKSEIEEYKNEAKHQEKMNEERTKNFKTKLDGFEKGYVEKINRLEKENREYENEKKAFLETIQKVDEDVINYKTTIDNLESKISTLQEQFNSPSLEKEYMEKWKAAEQKLLNRVDIVEFEIAEKVTGFLNEYPTWKEKGKKKDEKVLNYFNGLFPEEKDEFNKEPRIEEGEDF